jgi:hypothetical protein
MKQAGWKKKFYVVFNFAVTASCLIILIGCGPDKSARQSTIEEADGIIVVKNPIEPIYEEDILVLEEEFTLGAEKDTDEYLFEVISDVTIDSDYNIYVLDNKACMVRVFTENGTHLRDIGRRGQGPGEFEYPVEIQITSDNELFVAGFRYIIYFSREGNYKRRINVAFNDLSPKLNSQGNIIARTDILGEKIRWELNKYSMEGEKLNTLVEMEIVRDLDKYDPFYHIIYYTVLPDDSVVWALNKKYELMFINQKDDLFLRVEKDYTPINLRQKSIESIKNNQKKDASRTHIIPKFYPPIRGIFSDDGGRIYVQTFEIDSENLFFFDIFSNEGKYLAKVALKGFLACWQKEKLYTIEQDANGYEYVKCYKVTWKI